MQADLPPPMDLAPRQRPRPPCSAARQARGAPRATLAQGSPSEHAHPDALRRRQEALRRQEERAQELRVDAEPQWWQTDMPPNMVAVSSPEEFQRLVAERPLVVASFFVSWCTGCRRLSPKWRRIAANNAAITFASVNCGEGPLQQMAAGLGIAVLPYFRFYKRGECRTHLAANLTRIDRLRAEISLLLSESMDEEDGGGAGEVDLSGVLLTPGLVAAAPGVGPPGPSVLSAGPDGC